MGSTTAFDVGAAEYFPYSGTALRATFDFPFFELFFEGRVEIGFWTLSIVLVGTACCTNRCATARTVDIGGFNHQILR